MKILRHYDWIANRFCFNFLPFCSSNAQFVLLVFLLPAAKVDFSAVYASFRGRESLPLGAHHPLATPPVGLSIEQVKQDGYNTKEAISS